MPATIIDGRVVALQMNEETAALVATLKAQGKTTGLTVVLAGNDSAGRK